MMQISNPDLIFNVAQLLKESIGATRKHGFHTDHLTLSSADNTGLEEQIEAAGVDGQIKITRVAGSLLVQGDVEAQVTLQCSRCLDDFTMPVDALLEEQFQPVVDIETGRAAQQPEEADDNTFSLDANHLMDLTEPVRQALLVALPMKPLCREECKGLCPECGQNLNEAQCDCEQDTVDSRWAGLREIRLEDLPAGDSNVN